MGPGVQAEAAPRGPAGRSPQAAGGSRFAVAAACRFGAAVSQGDPMARVASRRVARTRPGGNGSLSGTRRPRPEAYTAPGRSGESMHEGPRADGGGGGGGEADSDSARQICCHLRGALPPPRRSRHVRET